MSRWLWRRPPSSDRDGVRQLSFARLAPAAASISPVRNQRLPFRVLPDLCLLALSLFTRTERRPTREMTGRLCVGERVQLEIALTERGQALGRVEIVNGELSLYRRH